ncbi:uncharacterized membrane protein YhaH (DUF805 family) [Balneicella halophila]|uniref:Uncharacterized membrane protein YhaH (DUF805 family) n=1 Tax=Balneicella halophila TaxID=1537566 RepID=A0A7L4UQW8_BALHA|nr:DUF805 domain-containing protein [Balneicella halophila]PVX52143.1 uncharacterized membrane protein YhaH (DUF805 family) [Balneicella halophila]
MNLDWFLPVIKNHYIDFSGRTSKKSFWMYMLYYIVIAIVLGIIDRILGLGYGFQGLFGLALLLPTLGIQVRRLQDTGRDWYWILIGLIPLIGIIVLIVFWVQDGDAGANKFGPSPVDVVVNDNEINQA